MRRIFRTEPERSPGAPRVTWQQVACLLLGIALLASAAWREANVIVARQERMGEANVPMKRWRRTATTGSVTLSAIRQRVVDCA